MRKGLSLESKLRLGLAAVLAMAAALVVYAYAELSRARTLQARSGAPALSAAHRIGGIQAMMRQDRILTLKHVYAGTREEKVAYEAEAIAVETGIEKAMGEYERSIVREEDRALFGAIKPAWSELAHIRSASVLPLSRDLKRAEAEEAEKRLLAPAFAELMRSVEASMAWNRAAGEKAGAELRAATDKAKTGIGIGVLALILFGSAIGVSLGRAAASARKADATGPGNGPRSDVRRKASALPEAAAPFSR